jgi:hypothetical protein
MLIATPVTKKEMGGTSYIINDSHKQNKHIVIVYPDGSIGSERVPAFIAAVCFGTIC